MDSTQKKKFQIEQWQDIVPIKQYDGQPPMLGINYPKEYEQMMDIFRAVVSSGEISERVYDLSFSVIEALPSNYNVWLIRRRCLKILQKSTQSELDYLNSIIDGNEKVYQIWEHRRQIIDQLNDHQYETEFFQKVFDVDNKNYHGWSYRIWLCQRFNLFDEELSRVDYYLDEDIGNNSAWNYRYFLQRKFMNKNLLKKELQYIFEKILQKPSNEASWNYLKGWFRGYEFAKMKSENDNKTYLEFEYSEFDEVKKFAESDDNKKNRFALAILIDISLLSNEQSQVIETIKVLDMHNFYHRFVNIQKALIKQDSKYN